ncbi:MAG: hypothetical protein RLZZ157_1106 [Pseudomonadota bacterium]|jgi:GH24 family phage-related lysozyme (muramidase)
MSRLTASRAAFDLITSFEGFRARAAQAPSGKWTLGFGHSATAREGLSVTRTEAEDLLRWDLRPIEDFIRQRALMPLTQNQFDALVSFAFNIGLERFSASKVLDAVNQGQPVAAALAMQEWCWAQVNGRHLTIDALVRRRAAEVALFLETLGARPAAPTPVLYPLDGALPPPVLHSAQTEPAERGLLSFANTHDESTEPVAVQTNGLRPFPDSSAQEVADQSQGQDIPAPQTAPTRVVDAAASPPIRAAQTNPITPSNGLSVTAWIMLVVGAALLTFGLYGAWTSGVFAPLERGKALTTPETWALFAAISGFTILVTTSFSIFGNTRAPKRQSQTQS